MAADLGSMQSMSMRAVIIPALLMFIAVTWWASRDSGDPQAIELASVAPASPPRVQSQWQAAESASRETAADAAIDEVGEEGGHESLRPYVDGKYRFLFGDSAQSPEATENLRAALLAREIIAVAINTARQSSDPATKQAIPHHLAELSVMDQKIGTLLPSGALAAFEVLKDSDVEQFQLDDYAGGVNAVAPLSDADRKAILYTKLVHRQRFRQVLADSGLMRGDLNASERHFAFAEVSRSLKASRDSYLQEVRQYLFDDEQFALLSNYENSEYSAEIEKLRGIARGE